MANLVQQQNYTPFVKPYVEGATKEYAELQNRLVRDYDEAALMYDSLQEAAENAKSLDAEGDIMQKKKAFDLAMFHINEAAKEGNYEDRGRIVRKAVKDFSTEYRPVLEAMQERQKDLEDTKNFKNMQAKNEYITAKEKLYKESGGLKKDANGNWRSWNSATNKLQLMEDVDLFEGLKKAVGDYVPFKNDTEWDTVVKSGDFRSTIEKVKRTIVDRNDKQLEAILQKYLTSPEVVNFLSQQGYINSVLNTDKEAFDSHLNNYLTGKANLVTKAVDNNLKLLKKDNIASYNNILNNGYAGLKGEEALKAWSADTLKAKGLDVSLPQINDIEDLRAYQAQDYVQNQISEWTNTGLLKYANDDISSSVTHSKGSDYLETMFGNPQIDTQPIGVPTDVGQIRQGEITPKQFLTQSEEPVRNQIINGINADKQFSTWGKTSLDGKPTEEVVHIYRSTPAYKNLSETEQREFEYKYANYQATKASYQQAQEIAKKQAGLTTKEEQEYNKLKNFIGEDFSLTNFLDDTYNNNQVRIINGERVSFNVQNLKKIKTKIKNYEENLAKNIKNSAKSLANYRYNYLGEGELAATTLQISKQLADSKFVNTNAEVIEGYSPEKGGIVRLATLLNADAGTKDISVDYMPKGVPQLNNKPAIVYSISNKDGQATQKLFVPYDTESLQNSNIVNVFKKLETNYPLEYIVAKSNISNGVLPVTMTKALLYPNGSQIPVISKIYNSKGQLVPVELGDEIINVVQNGKIVQSFKK